MKCPDVRNTSDANSEALKTEASCLLLASSSLSLSLFPVVPRHAQILNHGRQSQSIVPAVSGRIASPKMCSRSTPANSDYNRIITPARSSGPTQIHGRSSTIVDGEKNIKGKLSNDQMAMQISRCAGIGVLWPVLGRLGLGHMTVRTSKSIVPTTTRHNLGLSLAVPAYYSLSESADSALLSLSPLRSP